MSTGTKGLENHEFLIILLEIKNDEKIINVLSKMVNQKRNNNTRKNNKYPIPKCQCFNGNESQNIPCKEASVNGTLFCANHQTCQAPPLSQSEPMKNNGEYNNNPNIYKSHNCYSYAMHVIDPKNIEMCKKNKKGDCRQFFHQPGALSGQRNALNAEDRRTCSIVENLMKSDIPGVTNSSFYGQCPTGTSKVAAVVDKGVDYHWYRQDSNGFYTHKDGSNKAKDYDALGQKIFNPELASRDYRHKGSDLNYDNFCGFYCVPRKTPIVLGQGGASVNKTKRRMTRTTRQKGSGMEQVSIQRGTGLSWKDYRSKARQTRRRR
jgi:hypothetical protein